MTSGINVVLLLRRHILILDQDYVPSLDLASFQNQSDVLSEIYNP